MAKCPFCDSSLGAGGGCEGCGYMPFSIEDRMTPDRPYDLMPDTTVHMLVEQLRAK